MVPITGFSNPLGQYAVVSLGRAGVDQIPCLAWVDHKTAIAWSRDLNRSIQGSTRSFWVVPAECAPDVDLVMAVGLAVRF